MAHRSDSQHIFTLLMVAALICGLRLSLQPPRSALAASDYSAWNDLGIVYTAPSGKAYYPSVVYDANGFGGASPLYKMWYSSGLGGVFLTTSTNGVSWSAPSGAGTGLGADAHHAQVIYDGSCFGVLPCDGAAVKYKIWYWDLDADLYSIAAMATAQSTDGLTWTDDTTLTQSATAPLVAASGWNRGTYGPISLVYQAVASDTGTNPWNYSYVMYYDGTSGGTEETGLAYSADGLFWTAYAPNPVLARGGGTVWDANYATYGAVMRLGGTWHFWYSGGVSGANEGIGYASSSDSFTWTKDTGNPIFHISQGVSHRIQRVYTPSVIDDGSGILKMYYSAIGTDGLYKIGLALLPYAPATVFVDDDWVSLSSPAQVTFPGDPNPHFISIDAFATIQGGVNAVKADGTVNVAAGTYNESLSISKPLTLHSSSGAASTTINGGDPYSVLITSRDVTVDGFTITNPGYTGASDAAGIVVEPDPYGTNLRVRITNNLIHDIGSPSRTSVAYGNCGINIGFTDGVEIDRNEIYNIIHNDPVAWANGVCIWGGDSTTPADHISIHDNSFHDISSPYPADAAISTQTDVRSVTVYNNSIVSTPGNPTEYGVEVRSTNTVDASANWWGTNTPSGVAVLVSANVDYTPWLNSGTDTSADPGFQGDFSNLWVDDDSPQTGSLGRIQEGVNAVTAGGTVNVVAGTYSENLTIAKALTLRGVLRPDLNAGSGVAIQCTAAGSVIVKGFDIQTTGTVFDLSACTFTAYANNISSFATARSGAGGAVNLFHNWWGTNSPTQTAPSGLSAADWQARLGAPVNTWADGNSSASLGNANLSGGAGTAVIVSHGRGLSNAPFGSGIDPDANAMCSDYYDFFTEGGSDNWNVTVPVSDTAVCNDNVLTPGFIYWIPVTTTYSSECSPADNTRLLGFGHNRRNNRH